MKGLVAWAVVLLGMVALLWILLLTGASVSEGSIRPDLHPSCKKKAHCRVHWRKKPYSWRAVWIATDGTKVYVRCWVYPTGRTSCTLLGFG